MKKNMGMTDRILRIMVSAVIVILYFTRLISGTTALVLLVVATVFVLTSFFSFCPLYRLIGLSSAPSDKKS